MEAFNSSVFILPQKSLQNSQAKDLLFVDEIFFIFWK